ncbi:MAG: hypothetical protein K9K32_05185 [Halanaerobiales bacterium]|nr:hypothetical protein [Halanaerobiales bacterium]
MLNKKILKLFLVLVVGLIILAGCSNNNNNNTQESEYTLAVDVIGEGTVVDDDVNVITVDVYATGTELRLTAVPEGDWLFSHWEGDYSGNDNPKEVIMDGNKEITAVFQATDLVGDQPYEITNWYQLNEVRNNLDSNFILMNDLDSSSLGYLEFVGNQTKTSKGWEPLGDETTEFSGEFNGDNKIIGDLYIKRSDQDSIGLFGASSGNIDNLGVEVIDIIGSDAVGGLVGHNSGDITSCNVSGTIKGNDYVGGLLGFNESTGEVIKSYSMSDVIGNNNYIGGLIGYNYGYRVEDNYAIGSVIGTEYVGGLIGYTYNLYNDSINRTYFAGDVVAGLNYGGLIGYNEDIFYNNVNNSYWDTEAGNREISHSEGGQGKTTSQMVQEETFHGWDFSDVWTINQGETYPYFQGQEDNIPTVE